MSEEEIPKKALFELHNEEWDEKELENGNFEFASKSTDTKFELTPRQVKMIAAMIAETLRHQKESG